jgi:hypothetical protein
MFSCQSPFEGVAACVHFSRKVERMLSLLFAMISLLYATVGQAGGTAFLALMAFASFPPNEMRPTALLLNIVAATYSTWLFNQTRLGIGPSFVRFYSHRCQPLSSVGSSCLISVCTTLLPALCFYARHQFSRFVATQTRRRTNCRHCVGPRQWARRLGYRVSATPSIRLLPPRCDEPPKPPE